MCALIFCHKTADRSWDILPSPVLTFLGDEERGTIQENFLTSARLQGFRWLAEVRRVSIKNLELQEPSSPEFFMWHATYGMPTWSPQSKPVSGEGGIWETSRLQDSGKIETDNATTRLDRDAQSNEIWSKSSKLHKRNTDFAFWPCVMSRHRASPKLTKPNNLEKLIHCF